MSIDPVSEWALTKSVELALVRLLSLLPSNSRRVDETYTAMLQDSVLEIQSAFRRHLEEHEANDPGFAEKVAAAIGDREARALFYRLGTEAAHATTVERMRLLAQALAGLFTPDLDAEMRSRISRAVVELEPSDILALRAALEMPAQYGSAAIGHARVASIPNDRRYEALVAAGCIANANVMGGGVYITALGHALAKVLSSCASVSPPR